jgi:two-component system chemotaxis response regulator CheB
VKDHQMIRVLIVEDSVTARELLSALLRADPEIQVVGLAHDGEEALLLTRSLRPSVVTMDVHMPGIDGFGATKAIMQEVPTPVVIVSGSIDPGEVASSMRALEAGALAVVAKPPGPHDPCFDGAVRHLVQTVKAMAAVKVVRHWAPRAHHVPVVKPRPGHAVRPRVLALAASTGGPSALQQVLSRLPSPFPLPVLVVQHLAPGFMAGFGRWLQSQCALPVRVVDERARLEPGTVFLSGENRHLGVDGEGWAVAERGEPIGGFCPSASYLYASVARAFGAATLALVLTGMGEDGLTGLRVVRTSGGRIVAQDQESSVVFGMPGAAVAAGLPDAVLPLGEIAAHVNELLR